MLHFQSIQVLLIERLSWARYLTLINPDDFTLQTTHAISQWDVTENWLRLNWRASVVRDAGVAKQQSEMWTKAGMNESLQQPIWQSKLVIFPSIPSVCPLHASLLLLNSYNLSIQLHTNEAITRTQTKIDEVCVGYSAGHHSFAHCGMTQSISRYN